MKSFCKFVSSALVSLVVGCSPVLALSEEEVFMLGYIEWITDNSDLEYHGENLPIIINQSLDEMNVSVYGEEAVAEAEEGGDELWQVLAWYDNLINVIAIPDGTSMRSFEVSPVVIHELVHYLQNINDRMDYDCPQADERLAYQISNLWIDATNHPEPKMDDLSISLIAACGPK